MFLLVKMASIEGASMRKTEGWLRQAELVLLIVVAIVLVIGYVTSRLGW